MDNNPLNNQAKNFPKVLPHIFIAIFLVLIGTIAGWYLGPQLPFNHPLLQKNSPLAEIKQLSKGCQQQLSYQKYIVDPSAKWPSLITSTNLNFQLGGIISKIEKSKHNNKTVTIYTISSPSNQSIPVYMYEGTNYQVYEGVSLSDQKNLIPANLSTFKVGDKVYVNAFTPTLNDLASLAKMMNEDKFELEVQFIFRFLK